MARNMNLNEVFLKVKQRNFRVTIISGDQRKMSTTIFINCICFYLVPYSTFFLVNFISFAKMLLEVSCLFISFLATSNAANILILSALPAFSHHKW